MHVTRQEKLKVTFSSQDIEAFEEFKSSSRLSNISRLDCSLLADIQVFSDQHIWFDLISFGIIIMCARSNCRRTWIAKDVPACRSPQT